MTFQNSAMRPPALRTSAALDALGYGVHPVPCLSRDQDIEGPTGESPFLELRDLDLEATGPGERSHALVRVDAEHLTAPLLERPGAEIPVPIPTSRTWSPGLAAKIASTIASG